MTVLIDGIVFGESPRWYDGRLWFSDWGAGRVMALSPDGSGSEVVASVASFPLCIDFLPDGRLLLMDSGQRRLLRREPDGSLVTHADLAGHGDHPWNEVVADRHGHAWVDNIGFDFPEGEVAPGFVVHVAPDGAVRRVADDLAFPNGMAVLDRTLLVAESYASRITAYDIDPDGGLGNRRVWAETPGDHPDGICVDAEGAVWYADVANCHCVRVREGGEVLDTVTWDRGAFSCAVSDGADPTLFVVGQRWGDDSGPTGQVAAFPAPAPAAPRG